MGSCDQQKQVATGISPARQQLWSLPARLWNGSGTGAERRRSRTRPCSRTRTAASPRSVGWPRRNLLCGQHVVVYGRPRGWVGQWGGHGRLVLVALPCLVLHLGDRHDVAQQFIQGPGGFAESSTCTGGFRPARSSASQTAASFTASDSALVAIRVGPWPSGRLPLRSIGAFSASPGLAAVLLSRRCRTRRTALAHRLDNPRNAP